MRYDVYYQIFVQYLFFRQWDALRKYATGKGINIIGNMPIYMASDSADAWMGRDILYLLRNFKYMGTEWGQNNIMNKNGLYEIT